MTPLPVASPGPAGSITVMTSSTVFSRGRPAPPSGTAPRPRTAASPRSGRGCSAPRSVDSRVLIATSTASAERHREVRHQHLGDVGQQVGDPVAALDAGAAQRVCHPRDLGGELRTCAAARRRRSPCGRGRPPRSGAGTPVESAAYSRRSSASPRAGHSRLTILSAARAAGNLPPSPLVVGAPLSQLAHLAAEVLDAPSQVAAREVDCRPQQAVAGVAREGSSGRYRGTWPPGMRSPTPRAAAGCPRPFPHARCFNWFKSTRQLRLTRYSSIPSAATSTSLVLFLGSAPVEPLQPCPHVGICSTWARTDPPGASAASRPTPQTGTSMTAWWPSRRSGTRSGARRSAPVDEGTVDEGPWIGSSPSCRRRRHLSRR